MPKFCVTQNTTKFDVWHFIKELKKQNNNHNYYLMFLFFSFQHLLLYRDLKNTF
jgi:hypothetical protein